MVKSSPSCLVALSHAVLIDIVTSIMVGAYAQLPWISTVMVAHSGAATSSPLCILVAAYADPDRFLRATCKKSQNFSKGIWASISPPNGLKNFPKMV